jgi:two-component system response regulator AtoC
MTPSIVIVDSSEELEELVQRTLKGAVMGGVEDARVERVSEPTAALEVLNQRAADVLLVGKGPAEDALLDWLRAVLDSWPGLAIVLCPETISVSLAIDAVRAGVLDVLTRPLDPEQLRFVVEKALSATRRRAAAQTPPAPKAELLFGRSERMQRVRAQLTQLAPSSATVLVRGESGTGKELVARTVHALSPRAAAPFVKIDCASLPETLLESELFGYEKGAFTGAGARKLGRVELAEGGTLFLDEVGELALSTQAKLLRLLQDREIERLGGTKTIRVDVRVVAATHRDLEGMVENGSFRRDLFYRLNVLPVWLAPLRARRDDIADLAVRFVAEATARNGVAEKALEPGALEVLVAQRWPGNVRQLQNFVERLVVLSSGTTIKRAEVEGELSRPVRFETETGPAGGDVVPALATAGVPVLNAAMRDAEREILLRTLRQVGGNRSAAARVLGVSRSTLYNKLEEHDLS